MVFNDTRNVVRETTLAHYCIKTVRQFQNVLITIRAIRRDLSFCSLSISQKLMQGQAKNILLRSMQWPEEIRTQLQLLSKNIRNECKIAAGFAPYFNAVEQELNSLLREEDKSPLMQFSLAMQKIKQLPSKELVHEAIDYIDQIIAVLGRIHQHLSISEEEIRDKQALQKQRRENNYLFHSQQDFRKMIETAARRTLFQLRNKYREFYATEITAVSVQTVESSISFPTRREEQVIILITVTLNHRQQEILQETRILYDGLKDKFMVYAGERRGFLFEATTMQEYSSSAELEAELPSLVLQFDIFNMKKKAA